MVELWWSKALISLPAFSKRGVAMIILILMGVLVGAVLVRFKVLVLVPVICAALPLVVVAGITRGEGFWRLALAMIVVATSLQLGYLLANFVQLVVGAARATNHRRASMPTSAGMSGSL
jgi:hypothetical protein